MAESLVVAMVLAHPDPRVAMDSDSVSHYEKHNRIVNVLAACLVRTSDTSTHRPYRNHCMFAAAVAAQRQAPAPEEQFVPLPSEAAPAREN